MLQRLLLQKQLGKHKKTLRILLKIQKIKKNLNFFSKNGQKGVNDLKLRVVNIMRGHKSFMNFDTRWNPSSFQKNSNLTRSIKCKNNLQLEFMI